MTELTPFERTLNSDTTLVVEEGYGPSLPVILVGANGAEHNSAVMGGVEYPMLGLFERQGTDVTPGVFHGPVMSTSPMLHIQVSLVQAALGRPLSRRDTVTMRGTAYRPENPFPDGFGMIACKLLEKDDG